MNTEILNKKLHTEYACRLPEWDKYIIWIYTLGSAAVNGDLIGFEPDLQRYLRWADKFLTLHKTSVGDLRIPIQYEPYSYLFKNPKQIKEMDNPLLICRALGGLYADDLQRIIMSSPPLQGDITVYKASNPYNELEVGNDIFQKSFNSSSYSFDIDFSAFLPHNPLCCMNKITIPSGSRVLFVPDSYSAYPDEDEVIIPREVIFSVLGSEMVQMTITTNPNRFVKEQNWPYTIGPVYRYNKYSIITGENRDILMYISILIQ